MKNRLIQNLYDIPYDSNMPLTLLDRLIEKYPTAKRQTLKRMVQAGRVRVNGRAAAMLKMPLDEHAVLTVDENLSKGPACAARAASRSV